MKRWMFVLAGAIVGGLGFGFLWIAHQGLYALALPGSLLGIGASLFKNRSTAVCIVCGFLALALGLLAQWRFAPFVKDERLGYFLSHVHQLKPITLIMIGMGTVIGIWAPFNRRQLEARGASV